MFCSIKRFLWFLGVVVLVGQPRTIENAWARVPLDKYFDTAFTELTDTGPIDDVHGMIKLHNRKKNRSFRVWVAGPEQHIPPRGTQVRSQDGVVEISGGSQVELPFDFGITSQAKQHVNLTIVVADESNVVLGYQHVGLYFSVEGGVYSRSTFEELYMPKTGVSLEAKKTLPGTDVLPVQRKSTREKKASSSTLKDLSLVGEKIGFTSVGKLSYKGLCHSKNPCKEKAGYYWKVRLFRQTATITPKKMTILVAESHVDQDGQWSIEAKIPKGIGQVLQITFTPENEYVVVQQNAGGDYTFECPSCKLPAPTTSGSVINFGAPTIDLASNRPGSQVAGLGEVYQSAMDFWDAFPRDNYNWVKSKE